MPGASASSVGNRACGGSTVLPPTLRLYTRLVIAAGGGVILHSIVGLFHAPYPLWWLMFAALAVVAGSFTMKIAAVSATVSVTDTFLIAAAMLFGPASPTVAIAASSCIESARRHHTWGRIAFNTAASGFSMWSGSQAFFLCAGVPPIAAGAQPVATVIVPLLALTIVHFVLNSGLTAIAIGLDAGESPFRIWNRHFRWLSISYLAAASVSFCLILLVQQVSVAAIAMVAPLLIIFHLTLRTSFGRLEDAERYLADINRLYLSTIETLAMAIDAKDNVTHGHVRRVQGYALALADALGIVDEATTQAIKAAALLHDTGKLAVPEHILNKPGGLTTAEFDTVKLHVDVGADILSLVDFPYPVVPIVRCHHENWDGSGYPRGIAGVDIPIGARILSVVDCYDALTSDRPYRTALSDEAAIEILLERSGTMYDPHVVAVFIDIYRDVELTEDAPPRRDVLLKISQAHAASAGAGRAEPAPTGMSGDVLAFVSLARLASGDVAPADVLALASMLMRDLVPGATAAWYIHDAASDALIVTDASGPAADLVRGARVNKCERLSGWVAANRQVVVNSDAALDLGARAQTVTPALESCLSAPLTVGDSLIGVLTLYAAGRQAFTDDHGRLVQMIAPHIAEAIWRAKQHQIEAGAASPEAVPTARDLRLISSR